MTKDDFSIRTKPRLPLRAGYICSFPGCSIHTVGPSDEAVDGRIPSINAAIWSHKQRLYDDSPDEPYRENL